MNGPQTLRTVGEALSQVSGCFSGGHNHAILLSTLVSAVKTVGVAIRKKYPWTDLGVKATPKTTSHVKQRKRRPLSRKGAEVVNGWGISHGVGIKILSLRFD